MKTTTALVWFGTVVASWVFGVRAGIQVVADAYNIPTDEVEQQISWYAEDNL